MNELDRELIEQLRKLADEREALMQKLEDNGWILCSELDRDALTCRGCQHADQRDDECVECYTKVVQPTNWEE